MYGQQCIFSNKTAIDRAEKLQAKLLKCSLGLIKSIVKQLRTKGSKNTNNK